MSLWTPDGERPVRPSSAEPELSPEEAERAEALVHELAEARQRLLEAPVATVLVNHALGIYELAALHLTADQPNLAEAQLAIDALGGMVDATTGRLGDQEKTVRDALHQLRLAFIQRGREVGTSGDPSSAPGD
jgi:hypothetical protein